MHGWWRSGCTRWLGHRGLLPLYDDGNFGIKCGKGVVDGRGYKLNSYARRLRKLVQYRHQPARFSLGGARSWPKGWGLSISLWDNDYVIICCES